MSLTQTQIKGTVVLNSDAGSNLTIGNSTATNAITGTTNINTSGAANTAIGSTSSIITITGATNINSSGGSTTTIGNISAGGIINMNSPDINIGTTTSFVNIGTLTGAGQNRFNKPITILYSVPTATSQLGYYNASTMTWATASGGIITTSPILPVGVYLVSLALATFGTFVKNFVYFESSATGGCAPVNNNVIAFVDSTDRNVCNGNCILNITTGGKFDIKNFATNAQTLDASATMRIVRLA